MPRIQRNVHDDRQRPARLRGQTLRPRGRTRQRHATADPVSSPARIGLLAPSTIAQLPSLADVTANYTHVSGGRTIYEFCRGLVEHNLAAPDLWERSQKNPQQFAGNAIAEFVRAHGGELLANHMDLSLSISDAENVKGKTDITLTIECGGCDYLPIGAALEQMEAEAAGLGGAFYRVWSRSVNQKLLTFDESAASYHAEIQQEWLEEELAGAADEEEREQMREQYETFDIEAAIPSYVLEQSKRSLSDCKAMIEAHQKGPNRKLIQRLLHIEELSKQKPHKAIARCEQRYDDGTPLPSMLVVFKEHDLIEAIFERESQSMFEYEHGPLFGVTVDPSDSKKIGHMVTALSQFLEFTREVCLLTEDLVAIAKKQEEEQEKPDAD